MKEHYVVEVRFRHIQIADKWLPPQSFWHFNNIRQGRPLYQRLSERNHLINKLQAGDTFRLERSILASKNDIFMSSFFKFHILEN